jgi:hypothetical protein
MRVRQHIGRDVRALATGVEEHLRLGQVGHQSSGLLGDAPGKSVQVRGVSNASSLTGLRESPARSERIAAAWKRKLGKN